MNDYTLSRQQSLSQGSRRLSGSESTPAYNLDAHSSNNREASSRANSDLCRLARFGANLTDAHSCFIFLASDIYSSLRSEPLQIGSSHPDNLILTGYHSLSNDIVSECQIARGNGLIGWVAKHNRMIHVSPFDHDSRTLGTYTQDQQLKSFIGVPVNIQVTTGLKSNERGAANTTTTSGVIACDSKKSFAFSKLQGKLLEDLAREVANSVQLLIRIAGEDQPEVAWRNFLRRSEDLAAALGSSSVEVVRLSNFNFTTLEKAFGTAGCIAILEQTYRLVQQALPPHFPAVRLPNGDMLITLDNMMTSFYESRIRAVVEHVTASGQTLSAAQKVQFEFRRPITKDRRRRPLAITEMVIETASGETSDTEKKNSPIFRLEQEANYGNRRG